jgi:hypothetical protein
MKALYETVLHYCFNSEFHEGKQGVEIIADERAGVGLPASPCTSRGESVAERRRDVIPSGRRFGLRVSAVLHLDGHPDTGKGCPRVQVAAAWGRGTLDNPRYQRYTVIL